MHHNTFILSGKSVFRLLILAMMFFIMASTLGQLIKYKLGYPNVFGLVDLFYLGNETNIPTLFSVILLLLCSALLGLIWCFARQNKDRLWCYWAALSIGFAYIALDEFVEIHNSFERMIYPLLSILHISKHPMFQYTWVILGIMIVVLVLIVFSRFLLALPAKTGFDFFTAGAVYVSGAVGMELIGGNFHALYGPENLEYKLIATLEESLEMFGAILFIRALIDYISSKQYSFSSVFKP